MIYQNRLNALSNIFFFGLMAKFWSGDQMPKTSSTNERREDIPVFSITECEDKSLRDQTFAITEYPFHIGRAANNDLIFHELSVSWAHAKISCLENEIILQDRGSKFGTFANGEKLGTQSVPLTLGDEIQLGAKTKIKWVSGNLDKTIDLIKNSTAVSNDVSNETTMLQPRDIDFE
jgi:pSer/pThr/pTyr-binding forkhead associated (FHA) protein